jgi:hypothetical protein
MPRGKRYAYILDGLTEEKGEIIAKGLRAIPDIFEVEVMPNRGVVQVRARKDVEDQVRIACDIAKARFRTKVK